MHLTSATSVRELAFRLAEVLADVPADPFECEWLAVPSDGMRRWLTLELAGHLGAVPGRGDGVAANIVRAYPGTLRTAVLAAGRGADDSDPWSLGRLVWAVLEVADRHPGPASAALGTVAPGASRYGRARQVADLFDRYHLQRPAMIRSWADGFDVDGSGQRLSDRHRWQPELWRLVRRHLDEPSPPERLPGLLDGVRQGTVELDLPGRLILFGFSVLPGAGFLDLAQAVAARRQVHLFVVEPCPFDGTRLLDAFPPPPRDEPRLRANDPTADLVAHPLLRSWGRLPREAALLLADAQSTGLPATGHLDGDHLDVAGSAGGDRQPSLLGRLQHDLRTNTRPLPAPVDPGDRSIQFHACFGDMRQVEALRDALLHLLNEPGSDLTEDDIVVLCPALDRFAPLVEAAFGPSAEARSAPEAEGRPRLRYRIADQSIRFTNPVLGATTALLELVTGRFDAAAVLDFLGQAPVRIALDLDDDDLATIAGWAEETMVRWGLDPAQRARIGVPESVEGGSWQDGLDRLLFGAAVHDDGLDLAIGSVAPYGVEGSDVDTLSRLAWALVAIAALEAEVEHLHVLDEWMDILQQACAELIASPQGEPWQAEALTRIMADVVEASGGPGGSRVLLTFGDLCRVVDERLADEAGRPDFFRGGITVTSLTPLRWVPFRVVCLLGLDQAAFSSPAISADDLVGAAPQVGDRDPRGESRQALLEAVLSAGDRLVVTRQGYDVRTNQSVPRSVVAAELFDAVVAMAPVDGAAELARRLEIEHPRHPFDEPCLTDGSLLPGQRWSFSPSDLDGAVARRSRAHRAAPFLASPLAPAHSPVIDLDDLRAFLADPVKTFMTGVLDLQLPKERKAVDAVLPLQLVGLERWSVGNRLLRSLLDGDDLARWIDKERASGTLPPGVLEEPALGELLGTVTALLDRADDVGFRRGQPDLFDVDVLLDDGTRVVGTVPLRLGGSHRGPARLQFSRVKPAHRLAAWLDLMVLVAADPSPPWRSVVVGQVPGKKGAVETVDLVPAATDGSGRSARSALAVAVDCYRRGQREPLPLLPALSLAVHRGDNPSKVWSERRGFGEAEEPAVRLAFGRMDLGAVLGMPAVTGDPPGPGGRVARYARYLWGAVDGSTVEMTPAGGNRAATGAAS